MSLRVEQSIEWDIGGLRSPGAGLPVFFWFGALALGWGALVGWFWVLVEYEML